MQLDADACRARAGSVPFAVLATRRADGRTDLVPVTFALDGDRLVTAVDHKPKTTTRLQRLTDIAAEPEVALLFDHRDPRDWDRLWWVRARGRAVERPAGSGVELLVARYEQYRERVPAGPVIEVTITAWSGWSATP